MSTYSLSQPCPRSIEVGGICYTLDVTLKTNDYTLAKATVKGIKKIQKQTGKSPL